MKKREDEKCLNKHVGVLSSTTQKRVCSIDLDRLGVHSMFEPCHKRKNILSVHLSRIIIKIVCNMI